MTTPNLIKQGVELRQEGEGRVPVSVLPPKGVDLMLDTAIMSAANQMISLRKRAEAIVAGFEAKRDQAVAASVRDMSKLDVSESDRARLAKQQASAAVQTARDEAISAISEVMTAAGPIDASMKAQRTYFWPSKLAAFTRWGINTAARFQAEQSLALVGREQLTHTASFACGKGDVVLAAACASVNNSRPTDQRSPFTASMLSDRLEVPGWAGADAGIRISDRELQNIVELYRALSTFRHSGSGSKIARGLGVRLGKNKDLADFVGEDGQIKDDYLAE